MTRKINILGINGSASQSSSNLAILKKIAELENDEFDVDIIGELAVLPHFRTELTTENTRGNYLFQE